MEVFPALALPSLDPLFCGRLLGPRYNPARRKTFTLASWQAVAAAVRRIAVEEQVIGLAEWANILLAIAIPRKGDQDQLDAVLCALIGLHWHTAPRSASIMIGDRTSSYIIAPATSEVRAPLEMAAARFVVPSDVDLETDGRGDSQIAGAQAAQHRSR